MDTKIQYRVRPVTRFVVTRHESQESPCGNVGTSGKSTQHGEFENFDMAYAVGYALCKAEHDRLGYPIDDMRIIYPDPVPDDKLSRARHYRKMADELNAMEAQERYRRENPGAMKAQRTVAL